MAVAFLSPFDSLVRAKAVRGDVGGCGEGKKKGLPSKTERSPVLSAVLSEVRTFFEGEEGKNS
ncbi:MAG: hypothetical protein KAR19_20335 [Bacteroidales bacterium]|nr:hypothetical protein [Bacteroidales bacterium]